MGKFASLSAEAGYLREQISSLEAQLTRKSDSSNDLKEELLSARRAEEVVKSELAGVCAAKDALARQLDEVRTNLTWETSKASELEEQLSALKSELAVESSNEHELEEQLSALKSELASARDARVELERELDAMRDGFEAQL